MTQPFLTLLSDRKADIKTAWCAALNGLSAHTPFAKPELLVLMIDDSLDDLFASYGETPTRTRWVEHVTSMYPDGTRCALNPYVTYLLAGEAALVSAVRKISPGLEMSEHEILQCESELLFAFRVLHHEEVNAFCEICLVQRPREFFGAKIDTLPDVCPFKLARSSRSESPPLSDMGSCDSSAGAN